MWIYFTISESFLSFLVLALANILAWDFISKPRSPFARRPCLKCKECFVNSLAKCSFSRKNNMVLRHYLFVHSFIIHSFVHSLTPLLYSQKHCDKRCQCKGEKFTVFVMSPMTDIRIEKSYFFPSWEGVKEVDRIKVTARLIVEIRNSGCKWVRFNFNLLLSKRGDVLAHYIGKSKGGASLWSVSQCVSHLCFSLSSFSHCQNRQAFSRRQGGQQPPIHSQPSGNITKKASPLL